VSKINTILVVGLGSIGKRHIRILKEQHQTVKLVVLRHEKCNDIDIEEFGLISCVITVEQALEFKPDAAIIATPATKHIEIALILAKASIHLLIEKPISATSDGVMSLIDICRSKKIVLMTGYNLRFQPSLQEFYKQIKHKKIGRVLSVRAEVGQYLPNWRLGSDYRKGVSAQKNLGGGVLLELSHEIDYIGWIFGDYKWVKAHVSKQSSLEIDVEDNANIVFGIESDRDNEIVVSLNMDFIRHDNIRQCIAIGEKGSLRWDGIKGEVAWFSKVSKEWKVIFSQFTKQDYTYEKEIDSFFSAVEKEEVVPVTGEDGLKTVRTIDAIHQSHRNNAMVTL